MVLVAAALFAVVLSLSRDFAKLGFLSVFSNAFIYLFIFYIYSVTSSENKYLTAIKAKNELVNCGVQPIKGLRV